MFIYGRDFFGPDRIQEMGDLIWRELGIPMGFGYAPFPVPAKVVREKLGVEPGVVDDVQIRMEEGQDLRMYPMHLIDERLAEATFVLSVEGCTGDPTGSDFFRKLQEAFGSTLEVLAAAQE